MLQSPLRQSSFDILLYYFTRQTWLHPEMVLMSKLPLMEAAKIMKFTEKKSVHYCWGYSVPIHGITTFLTTTEVRTWIIQPVRFSFQYLFTFLRIFDKIFILSVLKSLKKSLRKLVKLLMDDFFWTLKFRLQQFDKFFQPF